MSESNTIKNKETGAFLCGTEIDNKLKITALLFPKQQGHSTYFEQEEGGILEYSKWLQEKQFLLIGWIHTHPQFESFMSSVDLHMQKNLQCSLAEAISIVVSPKYDTSPIFRLTSVGLDQLKNCHKKGTFHTHDTDIKFYESVSVNVNKNERCKIKDLRGKNSR